VQGLGVPPEVEGGGKPVRSGRSVPPRRMWRGPRHQPQPHTSVRGVLPALQRTSAGNLAAPGNLCSVQWKLTHPLEMYCRLEVHQLQNVPSQESQEGRHQENKGAEHHRMGAEQRRAVLWRSGVVAQWHSGVVAQWRSG